MTQTQNRTDTKQFQMVWMRYGHDSTGWETGRIVLYRKGCRRQREHPVSGKVHQKNKMALEKLASVDHHPRESRAEPSRMMETVENHSSLDDHKQPMRRRPIGNGRWTHLDRGVQSRKSIHVLAATPH